MDITPTTESPLHAKVVNIDLKAELSPAERAQIEMALATYGVLSFPGQDLTAAQFKRFCENFGELELNVANSRHEPGMPEMMLLSNIIENGTPIGMADAGQGWHTDLSYNKVIGYATILYGIEIPQRDGRTLGQTQFCNMQAAYEDLPADIKAELQGMTVLHDFDKFWEMMRQKGSPRPPLSAEQRKARPPSSHPVFMQHPISGEKVLYANPGYAVRINELSPADSDRMLDFLFKHQTQEKYKYSHAWSVGDVLMWDDIATIHNAVADYLPTERRLLKRCQVTASRFFN